MSSALRGQAGEALNVCKQNTVKKRVFIINDQLLIRIIFRLRQIEKEDRKKDKTNIWSMWKTECVFLYLCVCERKREREFVCTV